AGAPVKPLRQHPPLPHDDRPHHGIGSRRAPPPFGQRQGPPHPADVILAHRRGPPRASTSDFSSSISSATSRNDRYTDANRTYATSSRFRSTAITASPMRDD